MCCHEAMHGANLCRVASHKAQEAYSDAHRLFCVRSSLTTMPGQPWSTPVLPCACLPCRLSHGQCFNDTLTICRAGCRTCSMFKALITNATGLEVGRSAHVAKQTQPSLSGSVPA